MRIEMQPMGYTQTNCYIVDNGKEQLIIDPGMGATEWVLSHANNPVAILNTHGHYDHVWSNAELQEKLNIPIYIRQDDAFMLQKCVLGQNPPPSKADKLVSDEKPIRIGDFEVTFRHFPGHTPGCCVIEIEDVWFSGDFLFKESIGRWDFPYSNGKDMIQSIQKALQIKKDFTLYPGHGEHSTLKREQARLPMWEEYVRSTLR